MKLTSHRGLLVTVSINASKLVVPTVTNTYGSAAMLIETSILGPAVSVSASSSLCHFSRESHPYSIAICRAVDF